MNERPTPARESASASADWSRIGASGEFKRLTSRKKAFVVPAFLFFFLYFMALPISVGFAPELMSTRVVGAVTLAYLFALSQFVVGGVIAWLYVRAAGRLDKLANELLTDSDHTAGDK